MAHVKSSYQQCHKILAKIRYRIQKQLSTWQREGERYGLSEREIKLVVGKKEFLTPQIARKLTNF